MPKENRANKKSGGHDQRDIDTSLTGVNFIVVGHM